MNHEHRIHEKMRVVVVASTHVLRHALKFADSGDGEKLEIKARVKRFRLVVDVAPYSEIAHGAVHGFYIASQRLRGVVLRDEYVRVQFQRRLDDREVVPKVHTTRRSYARETAKR